MKVDHILGNWGATAMLTHVLERVPDDAHCVVLFYEDGQLITKSSHLTNGDVLWMLELAKLRLLHKDAVQVEEGA